MNFFALIQNWFTSFLGGTSQSASINDSNYINPTANTSAYNEFNLVPSVRPELVNSNTFQASENLSRGERQKAYKQWKNNDKDEALSLTRELDQIDPGFRLEMKQLQTNLRESRLSGDHERAELAISQAEAFLKDNGREGELYKIFRAYTHNSGDAMMLKMHNNYASKIDRGADVLKKVADALDSGDNEYAYKLLQNNISGIDGYSYGSNVKPDGKVDDAVAKIADLDRETLNRINAAVSHIRNGSLQNSDFENKVASTASLAKTSSQGAALNS